MTFNTIKPKGQRKELFLAVLESGAPLSSSLEEALYKCSIWMNEWMNERFWADTLKGCYIYKLSVTLGYYYSADS